MEICVTHVAVTNIKLVAKRKQNFELQNMTNRDMLHNHKYIQNSQGATTNGWYYCKQWIFFVCR